MAQRKGRFDGRQAITLVSVFSLALVALGLLANPAVLSLFGHPIGATAVQGRSGIPFFLALTLMGVLGGCIATALRAQARKIQVLEWELAQLRRSPGD